MGALNGLACLVALLVSAGEVARFGGSERFIPMAIDEFLLAGALAWAAYRSKQDGAGWHAAAWGALSGYALVLLIETADHQIHGPAKPAGPIYLAALTVLLLIGLWSVSRALRLVRR